MKFTKRWFPTILVAFIIFFLSSMPGHAVEDMGLGKESYHINGHFFLFLILCFTLFKSTKCILLSLTIAVFYGVLMEIYQITVPGRASSLFDVFVDSIGVLLAGVILWKFYHILPKKLKNWLEK